MARWPWKRQSQETPASVGADEEGLSQDELIAWKLGSPGWWGGDDESALKLLVRMSGLSPDRAQIVPFRHPRMLAPATLAELDVNTPPEARDALETVRLFSHHAYADTLEWPIGVGPLQVLLQRVLDRAVSLDAARTLAADVGRRGDLVAPYARFLGGFAVRGLDDGHLVPGLQLVTLLLAAAQAPAPYDPPDAVGGSTAYEWAVDAYVEVARGHLCVQPDEHVYWTARGLVDEAVRRGRDEGPAREAEAQSRLGRFLLDPYAGVRDLGRYDTEHLAWQSRRAPRAPGGSEQLPAMPEPVEALREAVAALARCTELGGTPLDWKAYVQAQYALVWVDPDAADHGADPGTRRAAAVEALRRLDGGQHDDRRAFVRAVLGDLVADDVPAASPPTSGQADSRSLAELAEELGVYRAVSAGRLRLQDPDVVRSPEAEEIVTVLSRLVEAHPDESLREEVLEAHTDVLRGRLPERMSSDDGPLHERLDRLEGALAGAHGPAVADAYLGLAATSGGTDEEGAGLELVDRALALDPTLTERRRPVLTHLLPGLHYGNAANLGAAGHGAEAIPEYALAAVGFAAARLPARAEHCLTRVVTTSSESKQAAVAGVVAVARHGLELERTLGDRAVELVSAGLRESSSQLAQGVPRDLPILRDQVGKGLLLAAATGASQPLRVDTRAQRLLAEVAHVETRITGPHRTAGTSALDEEDMLASYVGSTEAVPGQTPAEVLSNLRRAFDERLSTLAYGEGPHPRLLDVAGLQRLLGPRTLLISLFLGQRVGGRVTVEAQAVTASTYEAARIDRPEPASLFSLSHEGLTLVQSPLAPEVAELRRRVVDEPMFDVVADDARATLSSTLPGWLGPYAERLPAWREAGLDHLVIWPHGPLHYLPWHLFSVPGREAPLAQDWTVTVLPSIGSLLRPPAERGDEMVAVASPDGGRPHGLSSQPSLAAQVDELARVLPVRRLDEPTPQSVLAALPGARFVHLAAHGSHAEEAPAFQCLYLTPGEDGEGRLFAHQIAELDLSGVELVTLSACESALGRFDVGDNLRGLPAALLAAGASAVVGALWPVGPAAAATFFTTLYASLAGGADRLTAFATAQRSTRSAHPEYRDWGALTYIGDWRA